jgi:four helix bundle protein
MYNLKGRTSLFAGKIIALCQKLPRDYVLRPIITQLIRSGTSVGANYAEANAASSRKDFRNKIFICKKESQETNYWLNLLIYISPENQPKIDELKRESHELTLISQKITKTLDS